MYHLENGDRVYDDIRIWLRYNHNHPQLREWWSDWCVDRLKDPNIDGIFIDKAEGGADELLRYDGKIETNSNRVKSYLSIWERMPKGKILTGNILRTSRQGGSRELLHIFNSTYSEGWKDGNSDGLVAMTTADGICQSLQMFREAAVKGMMVDPNHANINHFVLTGDEAQAMINAGKEDQLIEIIQKEIQLPLAYYLIFAEPYNYFGFQIATASTYSEIIWNPKPFVPEFNNPLGEPLGPPEQKGYIFTRSFEHVDVWLDVETEECKLTWDWMPIADPQTVEVEPNDSVAITLTGSDPRETDFAFEVIDQPTNGVLSGKGPNLVYTPKTDYIGNDNFTFVTENDISKSRKAKISIIVGGGSLIAINIEDITAINTPIDIMLSAYDPNGTSNLSYSIMNQPNNGSLSGTPPDLTYTPNRGFIGTDTFTYIANNGTENSEPATVLITINATGSLIYTFDTPANISGTSNNIVYSAPDLNTFSTVTASNLELDDDISDNYGRIEQNGGGSPEAWIVAKDGEPAVIKFTLSIDSTLKVSFNDIAFDIAYWNSFRVTTSYNWKFKTMLGDKALNVVASDTYAHAGADFGSYQKFSGAGDIELSGLSDLSGTSVTFIWEFYASKGGTFARRCMGLDNVIINGTMAAKDTTVSMAEYNTAHQLIKVFPNPSNGKFSVFIENSNSKTIEIFNVDGKTIYKNINASDYEEINLSGYPKGVYILIANNSKVLKLVIK